MNTPPEGFNGAIDRANDESVRIEVLILGGDVVPSDEQLVRIAAIGTRLNAIAAMASSQATMCDDDHDDPECQ